MFTGIIEDIGHVAERGKKFLTIKARFSKTLKLGQSVAVNGVCLTIIEKDSRGFRVELLEETKRLTNLGALMPGDLVNLERAMKVSGRFDGHIVQGHVEGEGRIASLASLGDRSVRIVVPRKLLRYMILKGIVILDGIALTITRLNDRKAEIDVAITAYTWENTNLQAKRIGNKVNIETDVVAKYVERLMKNN